MDALWTRLGAQRTTQHLAGWSPGGAYFDYYERAHLNHVMAAHKPATGGYTYMTPMMTAAPRDWSDPKDDPFWSCEGFRYSLE